ncbi:DUF4351 domain-containing protein [Vasconcelosia minhoensis]|uniref:DUF4351 domain-containing protein n=1 Tax=Vasconcelosia minhoensis TaxID=3366354 RepID=UPI001D14E50F|nr:DUF4351 domain-containing protein [Romeria gracilis]
MQESVIYQDIIAEGRRAGRQEGRQEGRRQEAVALIQRQLTRRLGTLPEVSRAQLARLSLVQIEALGEALLDFGALAELESWLSHQQAEGARVFRELSGQLGELPAEISEQVQALSLEQLALLETALAEVSGVNELRVWLQNQSTAAENFDQLQ